MDWNNARAKVAKYFSDTDASRNISQKDILDSTKNIEDMLIGPIDWSWGKNDEDIDFNLDKNRISYLFKCNQIDLLIAEAGMLLDRALGDLSRYDELNLERFKTIIEFIEFDKINQQQNIEKDDIIYWNGFVEEAKFLSEYTSRLYSNKDIVIEQMRNAINRYDAAAKSGDNTSSGKESSFAAESSARAAYTQYLDASRAASFSTSSNLSRMSYHIQSRIHQLERQNIQKEIVERKLMEMLKPGGAINYNERMRSLGARALSDFFEVIGRLNSISIGMIEFYGINDLPPESINKELRKERTRIDGAVVWVRKAVNLILRAKMNENLCVIRKSIAIKDKSMAILKNGILINFDDTFHGFDLIQLRGISCCLESENIFASLDVEINSPEQKLSSVDIVLPSVYIRQGRISSVDCSSTNDVYLGRDIINRSPKGEWKIRVVGDVHGEAIRFLNIDFHLSLR